MSMFCYQCEQTAKGTGCNTFGVCGKDPDTAVLQDLLVHMAKGVSMVAHRLRGLGIVDHDADIYVMESLFTTVTNVNFDEKSIAKMIYKGNDIYERLYGIYQEKSPNPDQLIAAGHNVLPKEHNALINLGEKVGVETRKARLGDDITSLMELLTYGLKGTAAYADHAMILGQEDDSVYAFFHEALDFLSKDTFEVDALVAMNLRCGEVNLKVMELLDAANTGAYGHPVPTEVLMTPVKGKAILISGHDLKDLEELLKQTEGKGINIYTHGEMLPAHGYPGLKKYAHLVGNYGGAWQDQRKEFDEFPGAILMTTNCIQKPKDSYIAKIFTTGLVEWPGVVHIDGHNYAPVIEAALAAPGFTEDAVADKSMVGFGHNAVLGVADKVIDAVKAGQIKHFFLVGGCDGAKSGRNYYTDLVEALPKDTVVLTLACGKFRFNRQKLGDIGGIPRLLDMGQCNDAYSAIQVAVALANAFETDVNGLPLSMILSWYEQKAVCILLSLLHLGIKDIRLGPSLPAFVTPTVLNVLVENFNIMPITTVEEDLKAILG